MEVKVENLNVTFTPTASNRTQTKLLRELKELIMATREELNAKLDSISADISAEATQVKEAVDALEAKIAQLDVPEDFSPELAKLNQASENLKNIFEEQVEAEPQQEVAEEPSFQPE